MKLRPAASVLIAVLACAVMPACALAGTANAGVPGASRSNPLAGLRWGYSTSTIDGVYPAYESSGGRRRRLLAKIALRPVAGWFGAWYGDDDVKRVVRDYIASVQHGDPNALVQIVAFRLDPWEGAACSHVYGPGAEASYRHWIASMAAGIGSARVAVILQPDLPFATCAPGGGQAPLRMVAYAARRLGRQSHTTVYIDAGAPQWLSPSRAASMLESAGIRHARGFALNSTQAVSTAMNLTYGAAVIAQLDAGGVTGKHFVVNTSQNGAPFLAGQYPGNPAFPRVCASSRDRLCYTLGIPPTVHTAGWGLPPRQSAIAARYADAYLWFGRPWLNSSSSGLDVPRALGLAASSPY